MGERRGSILLTGGSGFIGRNLVEYLAPRRHVLAPTRGELDLLDENAVSEYFRGNAIDVVIHGATHPGHRNAKDPTNVFFKNVRMFFNIARNADRYRRMILLGSGAVYDMRHYLPKMREELFGSHVPRDEHGFSMYVCARHLELLDNVVELRLFGVFGKYEDYAIRFISNAICKTLFDLKITIRQDRLFDYLFVEDLGPVVEHFIDRDAGGRSYNVTPDTAVALSSLARKVLALSGKDLEIVIGTPGMGPEYSGDNSRLKAEIPGLGFTPIDEAVAKLYSWYTENRQRIDRKCLLFDK